MDRFRLMALGKLLRRESLSEQYRALAQTTFNKKYQILLNGARKRGNDSFASELIALYTDIVA